MFKFQVHKFMIAPKDFSLPGGELTPTMKIKRHFVMELYTKKIDQMYEHETQSSMWWFPRWSPVKSFQSDNLWNGRTAQDTVYLLTSTKCYILYYITLATTQWETVPVKVFQLYKQFEIKIYVEQITYFYFWSHQLSISFLWKTFMNAL